MESLQSFSFSNRKRKRSNDSVMITLSPLISGKISLNINLAIYLSEFLNEKDLIQFAYTNKFHLRIKNKYVEQIESI